MSQEDVNLNFASLPCYNSNWRLEEKPTKFICRKFQYRAQRKTSEMEICQKFQLEWWRQFIQLKFVKTQLGTGTLPKLNFVKNSNLGFNLGFPKLNFPKVMYSQIIQSFSSGLNTVFPSYILLKFPT